MSLEAFISGKSSLTSSGGLVPSPSQKAKESIITASSVNDINNESQNNNSVAMAERTNNLISSYRSYINNNDEEMMLSDRITGQGSDTDRDISSSNDSVHVSFTSNTTATSSSSSNNNNKDDLLRNFNSPTTQSQLTLDELWESSSDETPRSFNGRRRNRNLFKYSHPIYHSKRFKIVLVSVIAIAAIIGGISISNHEKHEQSLPNWNDELQQLHDEEMLANNNRDSQKDTSILNTIAQVNAKATEDQKDEPPQHTEQKSEPSTTDSNSESAANTMINEVIQHKDDTAASVMIDTVIQHHPTTTQEKQQEDFWDTVAPIQDEAHSVGIETITRHILCCSSKPPSTSTSTLDPKKTRSNIEQTNLSTTQAANEYANAELYHPTWYTRSNGWKGSTYTEAIAFCNAVVDGSGLTGELCPYEVYCPTGPHHIPLGGYRTGEGEEPGANSLEGTSSRSPIANYPNGWVQVGSKNACVQYTIMSHAEEEKENGKVKDTEEFLNMETEQIDNAILDIALANKGTGVAEEDGDKAEEEVTMPYLDTMPSQEQLVSNHYVPIQVAHNDDNESSQTSIPESMKPIHQVDTTVQVAHDADESQPSIPESMIPVIHHEDTTIQVIQQQQSGPSAMTEELMALSPQEEESMKTGYAHTLHERYKPLWLSSNEGWNGGSHDDAVEFCSSIRGKQLCPYSAMCPHGPGMPVMGGRHQLKFTTTGEQYAPVMGGNNHWVYIGTKDNERSATCMTHRQLEGSAPSWGLNSERSEVKQHIMCCTVN